MGSEEDRARKKRRPREGDPAAETVEQDVPSPETSPFRPSTMPASPLPRAAFNATLQQAVFPHVRSYDTFAEVYVQEMVKDLPVVYVDPTYDPDKHEANPYYSPTDYIKLAISSVSLGTPVRFDTAGAAPKLGESRDACADQLLLPRHCREAHITYGAPLKVAFVRSNNRDGSAVRKDVVVGMAPLMVRSKLCSTRGMSPEELQRAGEDVDDGGGYFIINGNERVIRFVVQQRTNFPIALKRPAFANRDAFCTPYAVLLRSQRYDGTSTSNILLDTEDGRCTYRILLNRQEHFCSFFLLLRCLAGNLSLAQLKAKLLEGCWSDAAEATDRSQLVEQIWGQEPTFADSDVLENRPLHQLGLIFWKGVSWLLRPGSSYEAAGTYVIRHFVLPHLDNWSEKFDMALLMYKKLRLLKQGKISAESLDSFAYQEVVLPGQILSSVLKDALFSCLAKIRLHYLQEIRMLKNSGNDPTSAIYSNKFFDLATDRCCPEIAQKLSYFMATGNIRTTQLDLQQLSGWTVTADRLNVHRFLSHFRAVHRGQFFTTMKTTSVRKLLGETWGFLCPVHTPDGAPCGLLLHLTQSAAPVALPPDRRAIASIRLFLHKQGVCVDLEGISGLPPSDLGASVRHASRPPALQVGPGGGRKEETLVAAASSCGTFPLVVDGTVVCRLDRKDFACWLEKFRDLKSREAEDFKQHWEVVGFPHSGGNLESIFIFTFPGRLVRPVRHIKSGRIEYIGPLMQPWAAIACRPSDVKRNDRLLHLQEPVISQIVSSSPCSTDDLAGRFHALSLGAQAGESEDGEETAAKAKRFPLVAAREASGVDALFSFNAPVRYEYVELKSSAFLSIAASLTPYSHHNQSPRNIYQCQMLKQTMGTPFHSVPYRHDNKAYRLITPQRPLVRTEDYRRFDFDDYPSGVNAVVAVMCYTGFDMEDAMILNKGSMERGAFHGCVYKTKVVDAAPASARAGAASQYTFSNVNEFGRKHNATLDADGFPAIGAKIDKGSTYCRVQTSSSSSSFANNGIQHAYKDGETAYVDGVTYISPPDSAHERLAKLGLKGCRASLRLRCVRKPVIGDKFASRHGQKGILSMLWPHEDMPFTESGLVPDILFNPHGFPSRMTIGMLIESMAGKAAAVHGAYQDATPFREFPPQTADGKNKWVDQGGYHGWVKRGERYRTPEEERQAEDEPETPVDYFGKALMRAGYQYYGTEELYSGVYGVPLTAHIFTGLIYYQRLRHMVTDKHQVRATGPVDALTHQPVKGRKRHGGVRFGEMERDALISHGAAALLQDRLLHCSDAHKTFCCPSCGSILTPYLANELAAMNVTIRLKLAEFGEPVDVKPRSLPGVEPNEGPRTGWAGVRQASQRRGAQ
ncbi:DNA-directed RNA polymerase,related [Neospora caninum Liverpool]|uniref:DNA-directed RNA polymerase subunit beta n=1 Tax=Neospora caninum (strain Liverpool) TaxID=572307 RepID=F0V8Y7_NEOCL|nr:DNA-directed RNA polymerase,related [Neospora caninum Liverpool]CBZ50178.1 DNA-directed RNA polymerase,related [Neospora caninum Liverpool]|eukprot:XP_003880213.1 DNA-directed RNA polymerase,related [Neospora caninum Liverpool]